jgi:chemotaxis protein methyltransferase CheR
VNVEQRPLPSRAQSTQTASALTPENYAFLQIFIQNESGIVLDEDKRYLIESRLLPILRENALVSLDVLCRKLAENNSTRLAKQVIEAMTTNETLFFRDPAMFDALRQHVLPRLLDTIGSRRKLRIWSAASSTGQEAYSVAMTLLEMGKSVDQVEIIGTDLSELVLERARLGRFVQFEVNRGLSPHYLNQYFLREGIDWRLKSSVRDMVRFHRLDLRRIPKTVEAYDLVLCRNVLIYFNTATKKQVLSTIKDVMAPGGVLILGCAETVINLDQGFRRDVIGQSTFYSI